MAQPGELTVRALARNAWIVAGLLLLGIGIADLMIGRTKLAEYQEVLGQTPAVKPRDPAVLFPKTTEAQERHNVAAAKIGFYKLLFLAGQLLTLGGFVSAMIGVVQLRSRAIVGSVVSSRSR